MGVLIFISNKILGFWNFKKDRKMVTKKDGRRETPGIVRSLRTPEIY